MEEKKDEKNSEKIDYFVPCYNNANFNFGNNK